MTEAIPPFQGLCPQRLCCRPATWLRFARLNPQINPQSQFRSGHSETSFEFLPACRQSWFKLSGKIANQNSTHALNVPATTVCGTRIKSFGPCDCWQRIQVGRNRRRPVGGAFNRTRRAGLSEEWVGWWWFWAGGGLACAPAPCWPCG